jgi:hypothetical protein
MLDTTITYWTKVPMLARVAELEDAVDLKSIVRKGVWVRVPPRAYPQGDIASDGGGVYDLVNEQQIPIPSTSVCAPTSAPPEARSCRARVESLAQCLPRALSNPTKSRSCTVDA